MKINTKNGYALLFAVLTATLVLGVAVFILGVSKKQFALSVASRESMYSLYAADSGIECAVAAYKNGDLATSTGGVLTSAKIQCAGTSYQTPATTYWSQGSLSGWDDLPAKPWQSSSINMGLNGGTCADVVVTRGYIKGKSAIEIVSRGYNYCIPSGSPTQFTPQASSRTVERAFSLTYK